MMLGVAAVAVLFGTTVSTMRCGQLSKAYARKAAKHGDELPRLISHAQRDAKAAEMCREAAAQFRSSGRKHDADYSLEQATWWDASAADFRERLAYHDLMHRKYAHAARYPWLPLEPDPPPPRW
jgi:hypothetical protein